MVRPAPRAYIPSMANPRVRSGPTPGSARRRACTPRGAVVLLCAATLACGEAERPAAASPPAVATPPAPDTGPDPDTSTPQRAFLHNLAAPCGQAFGGRLILTPEGDDMLTGTEALLVHFRDCSADEVRIPFHVEVEATGEWNRSRTWYVMARDDGLELRHDHREPDGAESTRTWYGGRTMTAGTATRQDFASPERTAAAGTAVGWRIEIEPGVFYRYGTTWAGGYDWMIEFDLSRPVAGDVPAAWGAAQPPSRIPGPP
jgi:hypothetical protein